MAQSRSIGGVFATLTLRDSKFRRGLKRAGKSLARFGAAAARAGGVATAALAAGMLVGTKRTITMGAELDHLSTQTGVAVGDLMRIQQAYKDNGKAAKSAGKDINKMQRAIFEASEDPGGSMDYFAQMGLSAAKLMRMNSTEQFFAIGKAIKGIKNQTKQAALAMDVFGRSGGELLTVFKGSNIDDINQSLGKMPEIMEEFSTELERVDTLMGRLPNKADQFFTGFTAGIVEQLIPSLESVNDFDFTQLGKSLGEALTSVAGEFALIMNATWDAVTTHRTFKESVNKFADIYEEIKREDAALRQGRRDAKEKEKQQAKNDRIAQLAEEYAYEKARRQEYKDAPDYIDPTEEAVAVAVKSAVNIPAAQAEAGGEISQFQRRGLSMSKNPGSVQNKVLKVQEDIRDILAAAQVAGGLKWAI